jgi:hypothetical protein
MADERAALQDLEGGQVTRRCWERVLARLDPGVIVPTHDDDCFALPRVATPC